MRSQCFHFIQVVNIPNNEKLSRSLNPTWRDRLNMTLHVPSLNDSSHIHQVITNVSLSDQWRLDQVILDMVPRPDIEHSIQLLKRSCFCFRERKPGEHETEEIPCSIEAESTLRCKGLKQRRPSKCENEVETPARGCCECHSGIADCEWLYTEVSVRFSRQIGISCQETYE